MQRSWLGGLLLLLAPPLHAQQDRLSQAFDLERRGQYAAAAEIYRSVLAARPADVGALLGLERALLPLNRTTEILLHAQIGLAANPSSAALYGIALRGWAAEEEPDSVRALAERWARVAPGDETPYREWGAAAIAMRDRAAALAAYRLGRERLGVPEALAPELAQLAINDRDYATAVQEWVQALQQIPEYQSVAAAGLAQAPVTLRPELLAQLAKRPVPAARRLEAELRARWGDPLAGLAILERVLPADPEEAAELLRGFVEQARTLGTADASRAQGRALEALAARSPPAQAARLRLEAAEAYSAGGDRGAARRMLAGLADDRGAPGAVAADAGATLVAVLIAEGKLAEASRWLTELRPALSPDRFGGLQRDLALGWAKTGALAKAESAIVADSSVEGLAVGGWIRLYRGDVAGAIERFKAAGPFAGERAAATQRTVLLALLQPIEADSVPELGRAFLHVARGDTSDAVEAFEQVAAHLSPAAGGAEVRLYAGHLARAIRKPADAERLFRAAAVPEAPGTAPAAELALGELLMSQRRPAEAAQIFEHLILTYPRSALVAQARRKLDEARGAVPKT